MLAIIDGDVLCYNACETRWKERCQNGVNIITLDENGNVKPLEFTAEEDTRYLKKSWDNFLSMLDRLLSQVFATDYLMAVKSDREDNYRNLVYSDYKLNRHPNVTKQNIFVPILRKKAAMKGMAVEAHGREADDLIRIWAEEARSCNQPFVVCTIDKDLKCIPGLYYRMHPNIPDHERLIEITEEEANRHYYQQLLEGDSTDHIPGLPGIGPVKAKNILKDLHTAEEFQEEVVRQYFNIFGPEQWFEYLNSNGKLIHIQRHLDDYFDCTEWPIVKELL